MTYTPTAYIDRYEGRWWVFITTPSGAVARLLSSYPSPGDAEAAAGIYGFKLVLKPPVATLHRGTTSPR